jgi:hypothetical protein
MLNPMGRVASVQKNMWEHLPCRICGEVPAIVDGRITHIQCIERLMTEALPRIEGNEEIKEYLERSAEWGNRTHLPYGTWRSSYPTVSLGMWVLLNDTSLTAKSSDE